MEWEFSIAFGFLVRVQVPIANHLNRWTVVVRKKRETQNFHHLVELFWLQFYIIFSSFSSGKKMLQKFIQLMLLEGSGSILRWKCFSISHQFGSLVANLNQLWNTISISWNYNTYRLTIVIEIELKIASHNSNHKIKTIENIFFITEI